MLVSFCKVQRPSGQLGYESIGVTKFSFEKSFLFYLLWNFFCFSLMVL